VFLVLAISLPAQKLLLLGFLDTGSVPGGSLGVATDSSGVYLVHLSVSRFVLRKPNPAGNELWTSHSDEAHRLTATVTAAGASIYVAGLVDGVAPGQTGSGGFDACLVGYGRVASLESASSALPNARMNPPGFRR